VAANLYLISLQGIEVSYPKKGTGTMAATLFSIIQGNRNP
jgi:hypothetical protein